MQDGNSTTKQAGGARQAQGDQSGHVGHVGHGGRGGLGEHGGHGGLGGWDRTGQDRTKLTFKLAS